MKNYTTQEVSELLKLEAETIREYIRSGKLKAWKAGKEWRILEDDLKEFIDSNRNIKEVSIE